MSRGPGIWQRAILRVADDGLAGTVCAIVKGCVTKPSRSDHVCARRSLKTLAMAGRVHAVYLYGCPACGASSGAGEMDWAGLLGDGSEFAPG